MLLSAHSSLACAVHSCAGHAVAQIHLPAGREKPPPDAADGPDDPVRPCCSGVLTDMDGFEVLDTDGPQASQEKKVRSFSSVSTSVPAAIRTASRWMGPYAVSVLQTDLQRPKTRVECFTQSGVCNKHPAGGGADLPTCQPC